MQGSKNEIMRVYRLGVQSRSIECLKRETPPASTESPQAKGGQIADLDIRQLEEAEVIPRQLQQADVSGL
ncbi:hypothetical protein PR002_g24221 [Phytophthora rubi]|uniref:Uncharacterized protein n=1 Tax=Phytophthora rubi TaxID=129364 RepID=A0A6A3IB98_9STRA|nr:hypothetical protein PR002_g24221 [Phytophthora rubi]